MLSAFSQITSSRLAADAGPWDGTNEEPTREGLVCS
jgi:hypothetical protein